MPNAALTANGTIDVVVTGANSAFRTFVGTGPLWTCSPGIWPATGNHLVLAPPSGLSVIPASTTPTTWGWT